MKKNTWLFCMTLLLLMITVPLWTSVSQGTIKTADGQVDVNNHQKVLTKVSILQVPFVSNEGQLAKEVGFYAKAFGGTIYVTQKGELVYALTKKEKYKTAGKRVKHPKVENIRVCVLKEHLLQAKGIHLQGQEKAATKVNYLVGGKANWKTNIPSYNRVSFGQVYNHIDLSLKAHANNVEKIFTVHPKGNVEDIRVMMHGAASIKVNPEGELEVNTGSGTINFSVPVAFQEIDGKRHNVQVAYAVEDNTYGFTVGQYNHQLPLIIDPTLVYSTYLGGADWDAAWGIAVDSSGYAYITGDTWAGSIPTAGTPYDGTGSGQDAFVTKIDLTGEALVYSTYLGGSSADWGGSIKVDSSGNAYVTGGTYSTDFPTTSGAYQTSPLGTGSRDAFITKLNSSGSNLVYSTYLSGSDWDEGHWIAVDDSGNAYVTGETASSDFPTAGTPFQSTWGGGLSGTTDAFAAKINPAGSSASDLIYSTFLGGFAYDYGYSIDVDGSGNAYITGETESNNFPTAGSPFQGSDPSPGVDSLVEDAFVTKLNATGGGVYSSYLGGGLWDGGYGIAVDSSNNFYVTGETASASDFPTAGTPYQGSHAGDIDAFVTKFNSTGTPSYSTFLGGAQSDVGHAIALDSSGNAYILGITLSTNFPTTSDAYQSSISTSDATDAFLTVFDSTGSALSYSTYFGGSDDDRGLAIALDSSGNAYITGDTISSDFPIASFQSTYGGGEYDAYAAKFGLGGVVSNSPPARPSAVSPLDEKIISTTSVTLQASAFSDPDDDTHSSSSWTVKYAGSAYYRSDYDASFNHEDTTGNLTTHPVSGLVEGMKYVWRVRYQDAEGNLSPWSTESSFKVGTSEAESLPQVQQGSTIADFGMISFVHWPNDPDAAKVINISYNTKYHRFGTYDPTLGRYVEYGSSPEIEPGKSYWVLAREGLNINYNGVPVALLVDIDVKLGYSASTGNGWNMVACPNAANYLWEDVEVIKYNADGSIAFGPTAVADLPDPNDYIDKRLWRWNNGSYNDGTTLMEKYEGYWVKAKQANVYLRFPESAQARLSNQKVMFALIDKVNQWVKKWILAPAAAIADAGDSPPLPMGGLSSDSESKSSGSCFIATAAYGSAMAPHVGVLREFRDRFLLTNTIGHALVDVYYNTSPKLAAFIKNHDNLKTAVRISLLPVVGLSWAALKLGSAFSLTLMLLLISSFIGFVWVKKIQ